MRHHPSYGCVIIHINLYGLACKNHDVWLGIDGIESRGRHERKPSKVEDYI